MAKPFGTCALCKGQHFLNHAGLCKRCNASEKSSAIRNKALQHEHELEAFRQEAAAEKEAAAAEEQAEQPAEEPQKKEEAS